MAFFTTTSRTLVKPSHQKRIAKKSTKCSKNYGSTVCLTNDSTQNERTGIRNSTSPCSLIIPLSDRLSLFQESSQLLAKNGSSTTKQQVKIPLKSSLVLQL
ncbi:hypothetical protein NPIL_149241 [Nephila pilipes]|uniref:Uncharacterized protein n=1 Tax=Nephila pilipes TaxID=299642 RepID=A0A8X6TF45_NEPPI|nr:hypothetical protein NPIL_149241 [Nephila pilipes]